MRKELFDSIATQNAEIRTVAKSLPLFLKQFAKSLFFKRLYRAVENLKYIEIEILLIFLRLFRCFSITLRRNIIK